MAKEIIKTVKVNIPAGKATPAPPTGPVLGQAGVPIMDFCNAFNEKTKEMGDAIVPVVITVYDDRSFTFVTKTPPTASLIKKAVGIEKGSSTPQKNKVGKLSQDDLMEIARIKLPDLNAHSIEDAAKIVAGTAKNMGVEVSQ